MKDILQSAKAIIFDVDQTLIDVADMGSLYSASFAKFGVQAQPGKELDDYLHEAWKQIRSQYLCKDTSFKTDCKREKETWKDYTRILCSYYKEPRDFENFFEDIYNAFAHGSSRIVTPSVIEFITKAKGLGKKIGALTNNDGRTLTVMHDLNIAKYFDCVAIACEIGWKKPSVESFQLTAEILNLPVSDCLYIGNSIELDYEGARNAGMQAILFDLQESPVPEAVQYNFSNFSELAKLL
ncbi:MAG: HAD family hydrolase [Bdellovibrionota bacterium]